jgi:hypothetical protein
VEEMPRGFTHCEMIFEESKPTDFIYLAVNKAFYQLTYLGNLISNKISKILPDLPKTHVEILQCYGRVALSGRNEKFETEIPVLNMRLNLSVQSPQRGHFIAIFVNTIFQQNLPWRDT